MTGYSPYVASHALPPTRPPGSPASNPWLIAAAVMLATFLEVLDTSVANVALPHIAGNLSASTDEATWVLTSYLVSNAIVLPMTGWLSSFFGRKRFLIGCIVLFTLASAACGVADELGFLILARVLQGAAGGALQPLSQAILMESFPPAKRGMAMAVFGMGVVVAPIIGPVLGGWITDNYSWRWIFYINVPFGILAVLMSQAFLEDPPYLRAAHERRGGHDRLHRLRRHGPLAGHAANHPRPRPAGRLVQRRVDLLGLGISLVVDGLLHRLGIRDADTRWSISACLRNRNFAIGTLLITVVGVVLYSTTALLPLFLQGLMGYPALNSGMAISPARHRRRSSP